MKGGVGKTTLAVLLARWAATAFGKQALGDAARRVLAIDMDPQANMSQALMGAQEYTGFLQDGSSSIAEVLEGYQPPGATSASTTAISFEDASKEIAGFDNLRIIPSRFDFADRLISGAGTNPRRLAHFIADQCQQEDLIIIDCAPTESMFTQAAYHASRYILVPVRPEFFATIGFPLLQQSLVGFRNKNRSHQIDVLGVVVNHSAYAGNAEDEKWRAMTEIRREAQQNGWRIFSTEIEFSTGFPKLMRGSGRYLGHAPRIQDSFARELFSVPELREFGFDVDN